MSGRADRWWGHQSSVELYRHLGFGMVGQGRVAGSGLVVTAMAKSL
ncbi:MAG: hypothetical protein AAGA93_03235 [Actinomycetota bacterium]